MWCMGAPLAEGIPNVEIWKKEKKGKSEPSLYTKEPSKPPPGLGSGQAVVSVPSFPVSAGFPRQLNLNRICGLCTPTTYHLTNENN